MAIFKSPEVLVNKNAEYIFNKIIDLNNLKNLMPPQIEEFESDTNSCSLKMQGLPKLQLEIGKSTPYSEVTLIAKESQVDFSLTCYITNNGKDCQIRLEIDAKLNMMMQMMVEKPLSQFLGLLATKMQEI
tara:strand:+ start:125 stop:514 length:390 start_codon:yes stop_codon:yes gene_type:complete